MPGVRVGNLVASFPGEIPHDFQLLMGQIGCGGFLSLTHLSLYSLCSTWLNTFSWMNSNRLVYLSICNVNSVVLCYSSYTCPLEHIGTYWLKSYIHPHPVKSIIHRTLWWWIHEEAKKLQPNYWLKHLEFFIQQILFMWNNYNTNLSFDKQKCCWK